MKILPFLPIPDEKAIKLSRRLHFISRRLAKLTPALDKNLLQARLNVNAVDYIALSIFSTAFMFFFISFITFLLFVLLNESIDVSLRYGIIFGIVAALSAAFYSMMRPKVRAGVRRQLIERDLPFALRHLLLKIRSGSTLYEGISSVAKANYGLVSEELSEVVEEVKLGAPFQDSLKNLASRTSSETMKTIIYQIVNAVQTGANLEQILRQIVNSTTELQKAQLSSYVNELNFWTMMYMVLAVIAPSLGVSFLLFGIALLNLPIPSYFVFILLFFLIFFEYSFIKFLKSRRPVVYL
ncbi:MAG: type II secretion system F family protein [Candidatus Nanoarchaeia archaeon]|nr:type II secretion system F family protein [Candidatus Haiyanarchaeum thermophilum]MCW1303367.1 type II secretion system F family protein [Candidatus Haiyanarchaeum thermophilum]MCW1303946.1 type II secretion system F family protein [Candidatus Haiyanarchaeum thermophilum]MCW1306727.1 type II secretion system F family protein [Candidatus Haiyanarchaeum thermophilum]MCW1307566.1 type II secretion system F family protein [Candidatus Haiyanarchaeum thermophilum]